MEIKDLSNKIPANVLEIVRTLESKGFEAYLVGGCVRDLFMGNTPKDWDITTNATPENIQALFPRTFYENSFGTVGVVSSETGDPNVDVVEVTPYRVEGKYSDKRHPDEVRFTQNIKEDLARRDFTVNSMAYSPTKGELIDLFGGINDIETKTLRAVGDARDRMSEDALRILRAIRFSGQLGFALDADLSTVLHETASLLQNISPERIRDEFTKLITSKGAVQALEMARVLGILKQFLPELEDGYGIEQNGDHIYDVWEHNIRAFAHSMDREWPLHVKLGALFHDIGKPATRQWNEEKKDWTFYGHDVVGARITAKIMARLHFSADLSDMVVKFVRYHLFFSDIEKITLSAVRRIVKNMGGDSVWDLMKIRACDRIGMGRPKEIPYRLRKYEAMIEEAMRDPISVGMLKINGGDLMGELHMKPGPKIGSILHALLEEVLDDPKKNTREYLVSHATSLANLSDAELKALGDAGKSKKENEESKEIEQIRKKHWVK